MTLGARELLVLLAKALNPVLGGGLKGDWVWRPEC